MDLLKPGTRVILGAHDGGQNWSPDMQQFVGKETVIINYATIDEYGYHTYYVEIDKPHYHWRQANMIILPEVLQVAKKYGVNCIRCGNHCPYADDVPGFKCYSCSH